MGSVDKGHQCNEGEGPVKVAGGCSGFHDLGVCELISRDPYEAWYPQASVEERSQFLSHWKSIVSYLIGNWMSVQVVNYCGPFQDDLQGSRLFFLKNAPPRRLYLWRIVGSAG